jgi:hypothetical protein
MVTDSLASSTNSLVSSTNPPTPNIDRYPTPNNTIRSLSTSLFPAPLPSLFDPTHHHAPIPGAWPGQYNPLNVDAKYFAPNGLEYTVGNPTFGILSTPEGLYTGDSPFHPATPYPAQVEIQHNIPGINKWRAVLIGYRIGVFHDG